MSGTVLKMTTVAGRRHALGTCSHRPATPLLAVATIALIAGCSTNRDSITVGAVPDDYRTTHPIVIADKEQVIDLPVGASDRGMSRVQRVALGGFFQDYDKGAATVVTIMVPSGSANEVAASEASRDFVHYAKASGIPANRIIVTSYQAQSPEVSAPIRVTYPLMSAQTDKCGRWPEDLLANSADNKHYENFGCSYQNNLAAQVANPSDLLGPRKQMTIDAERQDNVIEAYRNAPVFISTPRQEVDF
jgi:pilus assembly protein CpaD